jgi:glutamate dehydrogenase
MPQALHPGRQSVFRETLARYVAQGVSESVARRIATLAPLHAAPDIAELAISHKRDIRYVARLYFALGASLSLDWIRECVERLQANGHWHAVARGTLRDEVFSLQRALCQQVLAVDRNRDATAAVASWQQQHSLAVNHVLSILEEMRALPNVDFATLSVALQALRRLAEVHND